MAQQRIADQLPTGWESRDIQISGVVASLPQRFERGERFEFDVESVETSGASVPRRIALSFCHSWDDLAEAGEEVSAKALHPGALALYGQPEATARQRQSPWLRCTSLTIST